MLYLTGPSPKSLSPFWKDILVVDDLNQDARSGYVMIERARLLIVGVVDQTSSSAVENLRFSVWTKSWLRLCHVASNTKAIKATRSRILKKCALICDI